MTDLRTSEFIALLARKCGEAGGVSAFARAYGLAPLAVSETLRFKREPSAEVAEATGCLRYTMFQVVRK